MEMSEQYLKNVFDYLSAIKPGNVFDMNSIGKEEKRVKFVGAVKSYIDNGHSDFELSNDQRYVIRLQLPEEWR